jgi:hypothetical protein
MFRAVGPLVVALLLLFHPAASAQVASSPITKANALGNVRVSSLPGWFEFVSEESKFRVLFPGTPKFDDDVSSMKGYKFKDDSGQWAAWCSDLGREVPNDPASLRNAYQQSIGAKTRGRDNLFISGDVWLNGRLGTEFIIQRGGRVDYIRAFAFGRRLYTLNVTRKRTTRGSSAIPADVQQFFDSFVYWD